MLDEYDEISTHASSWHVYLFALTDCSAFKVGFSCNPLQRIHSFSRRYFERFDLHQSQLLPVGDVDSARSIEAGLKAQLAEFRADFPTWVPRAAGGHTEWFSAVHFGEAEERLRSFVPLEGTSELAYASDWIRGNLQRLSTSFELWALSQARRMDSAPPHGSRAHERIDAASLLRDWLDAYRYFDLPLFIDEPDVLRTLDHAILESRLAESTWARRATRMNSPTSTERR